jgi:hypothetical protein
MQLFDSIEVFYNQQRHRWVESSPWLWPLWWLDAVCSVRCAAPYLSGRSAMRTTY